MVIAGRKSAIYPDGEVIVAARASDAGPARLIVEGTYLGKKLVQEFPIDIRGSSELASSSEKMRSTDSTMAGRAPKSQ